MGKEYYIAACVFTAQFPELSEKIQQYVTARFHMPIVRCCTPRFMLTQFEERMPDSYREQWKALPDHAELQPGDTIYSVCHNCLNIIEETLPGVQVKSLWELILSDEQFAFPDYQGLCVTIQDCWRSRDRLCEQTAVRSLLKKMNISFLETEENFARTDFCGNSLYRPQPPRNPKLAPIHYQVNAVGKFEPHSAEEQAQIMQAYCRRYQTDIVVCYCHYCLEGLLLGGKDGRHLAQLLFQPDAHA